MQVENKSLTELQDKRGRLYTEARNTIDERDAEGTTDSRKAELDQRADAIFAELDALDKRIEREERLAQVEARLEEQRAAQRPNLGAGSVPGQADPAESVDYRAAFIDLARNGFDPQALSPEARAVIKAGIVSKIEGRAQTAGTNSAGGFTVPTELARVIDKTMAIWGPMYDEAICTVINTSGGNPLDFPTTNDTARVVAQHTEAAAMTDDGGEDAVFGKMTLNAFAYDTEWVQISMELLQDSAIDIEAFIGELLGERLARRVNRELTVGDGTGDPTGIVVASSLGTTAAATNAITADQIIDLQHSVDAAYRASPKTRFMFHDAILGVIRKLKDGQNNYLWQMGDVRVGAPATLLGHPYSVNNAMASSLTAGTRAVVFGDFSKYYVRKVGSPVVGVRREFYWPNIGLAGVVRLDGKLIQSGAVKHLITAAA